MCVCVCINKWYILYIIYYYVILFIHYIYIWLKYVYLKLGCFVSLFLSNLVDIFYRVPGYPHPSLTITSLIWPILPRQRKSVWIHVAMATERHPCFRNYWLQRFNFGVGERRISVANSHLLPIQWLPKWNRRNRCFSSAPQILFSALHWVFKGTKGCLVLADFTIPVGSLKMFFFSLKIFNY